MSVAATCHIPVLTQEALHCLGAEHGGMFLDCTFGGGGHSRAVLEANSINVVRAIDRDLRAIERAQGMCREFDGRLILRHGSFKDLPRLYGAERFQGIIADLGLSSDQLAEQRGFSFKDEGALDMRMDEGQERSAHDIINSAKERELFIILKEGGVGKEARAVTAAIMNARPVTSAAELAKLIQRAVSGGKHKKDINPATVVFQAIRIAVNKELEEIRALLDHVPALSAPGGRLVIISFHSLEDKLVAARMRHWAGASAEPALLPGAKRPEVLGRVLTKKALRAGAAELARNPRSRSALLRAFEFTGEAGRP